MKNLKLLFLLLFISLYSQAQQHDIESILSKMPDVTFEKLSETDGYSIFELRIRQAIDHADTTKGFFRQKVYLSHKNFERPTVMVTEGYTAHRNNLYELTALLDANQIQVEHRYFGASMPDSLDYNYLNLKQATGDLHHIKQLFKDVYPEKWVSTGISKGGATTIFYRYFFPNDIDVSVPYVAPINTAYEEQRIYTFLDNVGTESCRNKIKEFQIRVLENREEIIPYLKYYSMGAGANYNYLSLDKAFEYAVMEYPFSFWQYGADCDSIPSQTASIEELTTYFLSVSNPTFFSDEMIQRYTSHYYQSATEMGYYGYETSEFEDYLTELPTDTNPMALFFPFEMSDEFDGQLLNDVNQWLKTDAHKIIYIYGEIDTWSASAVPPNDKVDSEWFMLPGKHHGNARIKFMTPAEKKRLIGILESWLDVDIPETKD